MAHFKNNNPEPRKNQGLYLYGRHAVCAAINNPKRQINVIYVTAENADEARKCCIAAKRSENLIKIIDKKEIERLLSPDAVHQGFAAQVKELQVYDIEDICDITADKDKCHVLILDQVTDPQNIGAIIRSCAAFGASALIIQDKNSPAESGAMAKAAAGTIELVPIARVTNLARAIEKLKDAGFWVVGMDGYAKTSIDKMNKSGKTAIIMGSEGKGMRRLIEESCDLTVRLPIAPQVESLNVSAAATIALYEISKPD